MIGLGSIGRRHLRNLQALGCHDFVLYRTHKSILPESELAGLPSETDLQAALSHQPQAAIIANPTSQHLTVALEAALAKCHLFIEKPISHTIDGVNKLLSTVRKQGLKVLVGFQFRFNRGLLAIKELIENGAIAKPIYAHVHWGEYLPDWHPWEDYRHSYSARADLGGGIILTLCHPFDYLRWLFGEVKAVMATAKQSGILELDVEDIADINLTFDSGAIATVHLDYIQRPPSHCLQITGERGMLRWDQTNSHVELYQITENKWETIPAPQGFERNTMFLDEMRHFRDCIEGKATPLISLEDGIRALEIALAAKRSALEGRIIEV